MELIQQHREQAMSHIFISYSRQDIYFARYLRALFEAQGFPVWMDEKRLSAGMDWWDEIEANIDTCAAFVVIMSPESRESVFVRNEILRALDRKRPLFPVLLRGEHFGMLAHAQHEDMRDGLHATLSRAFANHLRDVLGISSKRIVRVNVVNAMFQEVEADVALLKLAPGSGGLDRYMTNLLEANNIDINKKALNQTGGYDIVDSQGVIGAKHITFIRTEWIGAFGYRQVRQFAERGLSVLGTELPNTKHIIMTIHGVNTRLRLDEGETMQAQLAGLIDVLQAWRAPLALERITIVELEPDRAKRIRTSLEGFFEEVSYAERASDEEWGYDLSFEREAQVQLPDAGATSHKKYALAIIPENPDLDDIFHYGIERPVHAVGLLCERLNPTPPEPDEESAYLQAALDRIKAASAIVCDVTEMTTLLYLQLGYALGRDMPVVLLSRDEQPAYLDSEILLNYEKIWQLEERLGQWLRAKFA